MFLSANKGLSSKAYTFYFWYIEHIHKVTDEWKG